MSSTSSTVSMRRAPSLGATSASFTACIIPSSMLSNPRGPFLTFRRRALHPGAVAFLADCHRCVPEAGAHLHVEIAEPLLLAACLADFGRDNLRVHRRLISVIFPQ